ncbi:hypothetical protein AVEN_67882-1 [Araneus ventricosus]|uniref:Uncharacterized protein n=1 Tax=Araneus ventricosus TaxID=182803 RepID=A0A4Y2HVQ2_ARAVE|nr:hypothetical protein AVEN_67882-1 [Araneus ventricosus]
MEISGEIRISAPMRDIAKTLEFFSIIKLTKIVAKVSSLGLAADIAQSPDLTPCDFFLRGYVKDKVYVPPMPTTLQALQERIASAVTDIDGNMLLNVWTELDYRWNMCLVTKGSYNDNL